MTLHFHVTRILSGHGCFSVFLYAINRDKDIPIGFGTKEFVMIPDILLWSNIRNEVGWPIQSGPTWEGLVDWILSSKNN